MICFNCGIKLKSQDAKECQLCGVKFAYYCPACFYPNPSQGKFCTNCGTKLESIENRSSVQNFDTLSENRRNVAVIFADISGFTALSEKMDPEEVRELINDCFNYITKPVYEMEGTIDKYIGDCVMILFGAKYIHADDAKRAVLCCMEMMRLISEFSEERLSAKDISLSLSIGINYGLVVTGSIGNTFDKDYTVMGDIVNTAQRLQSNAQRGNILVSESVYIETKDIVSYSKPIKIKVKNKEHPVKCYNPLKIKDEYYYDNKTIFVGRIKELNALVATYNSVQNSGTQCINLIGNAGLGKTSIIKEFSKSVGTTVKKVWVDCSSIYQNRVYYTISNILMNIMNINPGENASVKHHRLVSFLDYILKGKAEEEIKRNADFLGLILGLSRDNDFQNILNSMNFDSVRKEIVKQLYIFFVELSKKYKLVIIIDDVHCADSNSIAVIGELISMLSHVSITFILSSRYDLEEFRRIDANRYKTLKVGKLNKKLMKELTCKLLSCNDLDKSLFDIVIDYTNGNPLYIGEFIQKIKKTDSFRIVKGVAQVDPLEAASIPTNIQSLILANMSELDDSAKSLLQTASVVGKEFRLSIVCKLLELSFEDAFEVLRLPLHMNIISLKAAYTAYGVVEKVFMFNQDTERDAIYNNLLNKQKREYHKKTGEIIEASFKKEIDDYYEMLYTHFSKANHVNKAAQYAFKTAVKYRNTFDMASSLEYYDRFLELTVKKKDNDDKRILQAYQDMGYINFVEAEYEKALDNLNKALKRAKLYDDIYGIKLMIADLYKEQDAFEDALNILDDIEPKLKRENMLYGKLLQMKCNIYRITGNPEALNIVQKAEKLLMKTMDYENFSEIMNQAGILYYTKGDIGNSLHCLDKSYKSAEKINNLAIMSKVSGNLGAIYHATGMISKAQEYFNKSIHISKKISDQQGYIAGCINLGILYMDKGLFNQSEILFNEALDISKEINSKLNESIILTNLGDIMFERGNVDKALGFYDHSLAIVKEINVPIGEGINYISIVRLLIEEGKYDKVSGLLKAAYDIFAQADEMAYISDYYRYKSLYEMLNGDIEKAMEDCEKAISISEEIKSDMRKLKNLRLKADILEKQGEEKMAMDLLNESITLSHQIESDYEAAKGYFARYALNAKLGNVKAAQKDVELARGYMVKVDECKFARVISKS